jgi:hypothetical protein
MEGHMMRDLTETTRYPAGSTSASGHITVWNRRLLIAAVALILWAASMLALQAMGPDARALMAGEGLLIQVDQ